MNGNEIHYGTRRRIVPLNFLLLYFSYSFYFLTFFPFARSELLAEIRRHTVDNSFRLDVSIALDITEREKKGNES